MARPMLKKIALTSHSLSDPIDPLTERAKEEWKNRTGWKVSSRCKLDGHGMLEGGTWVGTHPVKLPLPPIGRLPRHGTQGTS